MKRPITLEKELESLETVQGLTAVFESIASMRISQIKDKVLSGERFFHELWQTYSQLRIDPSKRLKVETAKKAKAFVVVTSGGGLSGDIDRRIILRMVADYEKDRSVDIIAIGSHGVVLLAQHNIRPTLELKLPDVDQDLDLAPIQAALSQYRSVAVYYERYSSLLVQEVATIELISAVRELGAQQEQGEQLISNRDYMFEPSQEEIVKFMESVMLGIAISQVILDSKLAQYASRFNAMSAANQKAGKFRSQLNLELNKVRRAVGDERLKEIINGGNI